MLWGGEWTGNIQIDCVDIRDGVKILWNNLNGKRIWKRMDTCVGITESLCCTPVTNTSLEINYTLVLKKKKDTLEGRLGLGVILMNLRLYYTHIPGNGAFTIFPMGIIPWGWHVVSVWGWSGDPVRWPWPWRPPNRWGQTWLWVFCFGSSFILQKAQEPIFYHQFLLLPPQSCSLLICCK